MPDLSTFGYNVLANLVALSPVESVVIWLIWTTRKSARRASAMSELLPAELTEIQREALAWWGRRMMDKYTREYVVKKASGTLEE
ncbi:MAG: hypothetical protein L3K18_09600 [Thermoplasmata archaeon]|nr:hypothetical protein [Thermoplasmata archaeon]